MTNKKMGKWTALALAGVLATSCFVGGTFARYVTSTSSEDSARVAVWGINADDVEMDLFAGSYTVGGVLVADSEDDDNIIAPGTKKDNYFSIVNLDENLKPEVMYEVAINLDDSKIDQRILDNPSIQWRLDEGNYGTWEETKAQILALSGDASGVKTYAPLEIAENFKADVTHKIGWKWIMDNNNNVMDTEMGNAATRGDITAKISIKVTATQVNVDTTGMLDGNGSVYNTNDPQPLVFRSAAPVDELQSVEINGSTLTQNTDYTVSEGSTVITLKESYLSGLEVGNYTISIISNSMTANATFSVTDTLEGVAAIGNIYYSSLQNAINNAENGSTITLMANVEESVTIPEEKNIILNLNNKNITGIYTPGVDLGGLNNALTYAPITNKGILEIIGNGTIDATTDTTPALFNLGEATLKGGTYLRSNEYSGIESAPVLTINSFYTVVNVGEMTVTDNCYIKLDGLWSSSLANGITLYGFEEFHNKEASLFVSGGTITGGRHAIANNNGYIDIDDEAIVKANPNGKDAIGHDKGRIDLYGGQILSDTGVAITADPNTEIFIYYSGIVNEQEINSAGRVEYLY